MDSCNFEADPFALVPFSVIGSDNGETFAVNTDKLTVGGVNSFATEREAVFSLESSIHQLLCRTASATVTGRETVSQRCLRNRFSIGVCASLRWLGLERERHFYIGNDVEDGCDCSVIACKERLWNQRTQGLW